MKVCVIGSGGREHALAWRLSISPSVEQVYAVPGSDAMAAVATIQPLDWHEREALLAWLQSEGIDLVVIGPEAPLVDGLADDLRRAGIPVFGPSREAAQLEGSKAFAKQLMDRYHIPTAAYAVFAEQDEALAYIKKQGAPIVVKADGLAAGKGVVVATSVQEAQEAVVQLFDERRDDVACTVVIEEFMDGEEASLLAFVDGHTVVPMVSAQDHKRIFDGDKGPNTGGMGTYAPTPVVTSQVREQVINFIMRPLIEGMARDGIPYIGCLYVGLMITSEGPKVVEFNARFGDPETQVILPLLDGDLGQILMACATGTLEAHMVRWHDSYAACVIMASAGYPATSSKGDVIVGPILAENSQTMVFHSGTARRDDRWVTNGGRVLGVVGLGHDWQDAINRAYERVGDIHFDGMQYRRDIGRRALERQRESRTDKQ